MLRCRFAHAEKREAKAMKENKTPRDANALEGMGVAAAKASSKTSTKTTPSGNSVPQPSTEGPTAMCTPLTDEQKVCVHAFLASFLSMAPYVNHTSGAYRKESTAGLEEACASTGKAETGCRSSCCHCNRPCSVNARKRCNYRHGEHWRWRWRTSSTESCFRRLCWARRGRRGQDSIQ